MNRLITIFLFGYLQAQPGILKVGFDIDDTVLYSEPVFQYYKIEYGLPSIMAGSMPMTINFQFQLLQPLN